MPGLVALLVLPALLYRVFPPAVRATPEAPDQARAQLAELGRMSRQEWTMAGVFVLLLLLRSVGGQVWDLSATVSAFTGVALLLVTGVLTWGDLAAEKAAWTTLVWFAVLLMMASRPVLLAERAGDLGRSRRTARERSQVVGTPYLTYRPDQSRLSAPAPHSFPGLAFHDPTRSQPRRGARAPS
ncbi:anion permease [Streptomyces sp. NBC_00490]